jgi:hypothetical protein
MIEETVDLQYIDRCNIVSGRHRCPTESKHREQDS